MLFAPNFKMTDFDCKDGTKVPLQYYVNAWMVARNLQVLRNYYNLPLIITSGYRTVEHNKAVGGRPNSWHLRSAAADFYIPGIPAYEVYQTLCKLIEEKKMHSGGVLCYKTKNIVHYDIRPLPYREVY